MDTFKEFYFSVFNRSTGEGMIALYANQPTVGDLDPDKSSTEVGIKYLSFYMTETEFTGLMEGKLSGCNDIGHNVRACGDSFTFFDMEFARDNRGVLRVPYVTISIPYYVRRILLRAVRATLKRCTPDGERPEIRIPFETRKRWARQYGFATGSVKLDVHGEEFFAQCTASGGESFADRIAQLQTIAKNGTSRHTDTGTVVLSKDWDGFYFRILSPTGRCTLNGGVINHGKEGKQDWSIHT